MFSVSSGERRILLQFVWLAVACAFLLATVLWADNKVMGELELEGKSKVEKTSGVWIDGQYVGYLKELKGDKKVLLLPGDHDISVRQLDLGRPSLRVAAMRPRMRRRISCLGRPRAW